MQVLAGIGVPQNGNDILPFLFSSALGSCHRIEKIRQKLCAVYFLFEQVTLRGDFLAKRRKTPSLLEAGVCSFNLSWISSEMF